MKMIDRGDFKSTYPNQWAFLAAIKGKVVKSNYSKERKMVIDRGKRTKSSYREV